ncbi:MAG: AAA family ATPase [Proteobacteria bacterium]|nr:AAA family ATPase [Pseudomonadota bacterium]
MTTQLDLSANKGKLVAIASGKGGVGKTSLTLNIARTLSKLGKKVLVFDADLGLANVDVQLGVTPVSDLSHVIRGDKTLRDVITKTPAGFDIIAGRSGSEDLPFTTSLDRRNILRDLQDLTNIYDLVMLDVAAGVGDDVLAFAQFAQRTVLVVTPDPSSITDAYAVIKLLKVRHDTQNCEILVNQANGLTEGKKTYEKLKMASAKFLGIDLKLLDIMEYDRNYTMAVRLQQLVSDAFPHTKATEAMQGLARKVLGS